MANLTTSYLGIELRNPLIVGSCTHTINPARVRALAEQGAGAVVLKSIFEEQIRAEVESMVEALEEDTRAYEYLRADLPMQLGPQTYLERIREIRKLVEIPIIASINCVSPKRWVEFGKKVEAAGADAIELNIYDIPDNPETPGSDVEQRHIATAAALKKTVGIPVAVKIGPFYSSVLNFAQRLAESDVDGIVLFNRFFQPDINIDTLRLESRVNFSRPDDILLPLRWIAILRDQVSCSLSLTSGVHDAAGMVKALLAGADTVQICSALYKQKNNLLGEMLDGLAEWMDAKGYAAISDFRGLLREKDPTSRRGFCRGQYVRTLVGLE